MSRRSPRKNQRKELTGCGCPECMAKKKVKKAMDAAVAAIRAVPVKTTLVQPARLWDYQVTWNLPRES
jgi:hypothetical protein